jgi:hypothetical protein
MAEDKKRMLGRVYLGGTPVRKDGISVIAKIDAPAPIV